MIVNIIKPVRAKKNPLHARGEIKGKGQFSVAVFISLIYAPTEEGACRLSLSISFIIAEPAIAPLFK